MEGLQFSGEPEPDSHLAILFGEQGVTPSGNAGQCGEVSATARRPRSRSPAKGASNIQGVRGADRQRGVLAIGGSIAPPLARSQTKTRINIDFE